MLEYLSLTLKMPFHTISSIS